MNSRAGFEAFPWIWFQKHPRPFLLTLSGNGTGPLSKPSSGTFCGSLCPMGATPKLCSLASRLSGPCSVFQLFLSRGTFEPSQGSGEVGSFLVSGKLEELCICPSHVLPHPSPRLMPTVRVKGNAGWTQLGGGGAFPSLPQAERNEQNCVSTTTPLLRLYLPPAVPFCWSLAAEL